MSVHLDFYQLDAARVIDAIEALGFQPDNSCFALNSYENRVYEIGLEKPLKHVPEIAARGDRVVAKFYRPGRWTREHIQEEHDFLWELHDHQLPVVYPLKNPAGETLHCLSCEDQQIFFAIFPKVGGRHLDEPNLEDYQQLGRLIGRMHQVGSSKTTQHRPRLDSQYLGQSSIDFIEHHLVFDPAIKTRYLDVARTFINQAGPILDRCQFQRVHGDCHRGNILKRDEQIFFLDFDDMVLAPRVQDMWMMVEDIPNSSAFQNFISGYQQMTHFDYGEIEAVWALRGLRIIYYAAWLGRRREDPAFLRAFDFFGTDSYWTHETRALETLLWDRSNQNY